MRLALLLPAILLAGSSCKHPAEPGPTPPPPTPAPKPVAGFTVPSAVTAGATVQVQNTSANASSYYWQWGDGSSSTDQAPSHQYQTLGKLRLHLTATGPGGTDTLSKVIRVDEPPPTTVAGTYRGSLYFSTYGGSLYYQTPWRRDTTIEIKAVDASTLRTFDREVVFQPAASAWLGHAPERPHYFYLNDAPYGSSAVIQQERLGDSVYVASRYGGLGGGKLYQFFGKKR